MKKPLFIFLLIVVCNVSPGTGQLLADEIRVAVASNFATVMKKISRNFEVSTGHKVILILGSTGRHYAQIKNGAPFDAFFAADSRRPELLEKEEMALPGSRFTYAVGKIILWSPKENYVDPEGKILDKQNIRRLAIANPKLAPYGKAAQEVLQTRGVWNALKKVIVRGENIAQTYQFIKSGNVELGFVALSQVQRANQVIAGSWWEVPQTLYAPIAQQAVLLKENDAARAFLLFMQSEESLNIIHSLGYDVVIDTGRQLGAEMQPGMGAP